VRRTAIRVAILTVAFAIAGYEWPGQRGRLAGGWLGVVGATVLLAFSRQVRAEFPKPSAPPHHLPGWLRWIPARASRLRRHFSRGAPSRPINDELARMEGVVVESVSSANGVHRRLRPVLRDIVEDQLAVTSGLQLDRDQSRVRALVGDEVWELIRPDRPFPEDGFAPGLRLADLTSLVTRLERLSEPR
jgi:hypothetical protein